MGIPFGAPRTWQPFRLPGIKGPLSLAIKGLLLAPFEANYQNQQKSNAQYVIDTAKSALGWNAADKTTPERPVGTQAVLNGKPVYWAGKDYGWQQLKGDGNSATLNSLNRPGVQERFIQDQVPGFGEKQDVPPNTFGSVQPPLQRQEEKSISAEQLAQAQLADLVKQIGSPQDVSNLAFQLKAPMTFTTTGGKTIEPTLSQYYAAQDAYGKQTFNEKSPGLDQVIKQLGYDDNMRKWAISNPMLAQREYAKLLARQGQSSAPTTSPAAPSTPPGMGLAGNWIDNNPMDLRGGVV